MTTSWIGPKSGSIKDSESCIINCLIIVPVGPVSPIRPVGPVTPIRPVAPVIPILTHRITVSTKIFLIVQAFNRV